jgi:hypothetical protein
MSPQTARVLAALRSQGAHGITQDDFLPPDVIDGQGKITRVAPRIEELEKEYGHRIERTGRRGKFVVYRLVGDAQDRPRRRAVLVCGDYQSLQPGDKVPARGVAVMGQRVYSDGRRVGRTSSTRASAAIQYVIEPDGEALHIYYTPEHGS